MRALMFGWEFPPFVSGGLGVATAGLVGGLLETGVEVVLVLPHHPEGAGEDPRLSIVDARALHGDTRPDPRHRKRKGAGRGPLAALPGTLRLRRVPTLLRPYMSEETYQAARSRAATPPKGRRGKKAGRGAKSALTVPFPGLYGPDLAAEVLRYAAAATGIARREEFDVIHAHDWLTSLAGLQARRVSGRPLAVHVHATEFDRAGGGSDPFVRGVEKLGVQSADRVIAVSRYTARILEDRYGADPARIRVVHNAIDAGATPADAPGDAQGPLVLFAGRVTWQKGPEYFVDAAALVAREIPGVRFAVAGAGDLLDRTVARAAELGIAENFLFTGFLAPDELDRLYARADVYVMPSVSEPFGLTALEALRHGTPAIVARNAGVSEVVRNVLRVDFGDTRDLASKILSVLLFRPLSDALSSGGRAEVGRLSWSDAARKCLAVYEEMQEESAGGLRAAFSP